MVQLLVEINEKVLIEMVHQQRLKHLATNPKKIKNKTFWIGYVVVYVVTQAWDT